MAKDLKKEIAQHAVTLMQPGKIIGLGMGRTIAAVVDEILQQPAFADKLSFTSSAPDTTLLLEQRGLPFIQPEQLAAIDLYFDGCDQLDRSFNALKSMGGVFTSEKSMAAIAGQFILLATADKFKEQLDHEFPLVLEVLPSAVRAIKQRMSSDFSGIRIHQRDQISANGNFLLDIWFEKLPPLLQLNLFKMIPGVVDHSLFYEMAHGAIIADNNGVRLHQR